MSMFTFQDLMKELAILCPSQICFDSVPHFSKLILAFLIALGKSENKLSFTIKKALLLTSIYQSCQVPFELLHEQIHDKTPKLIGSKMIVIRMSDDQYYRETSSRDIHVLDKKVRKSVDESVLLAADFRPGPFDVICARGKHAKEHTGNHRFRQTIEMNLPRYDKATTKLEKSLIVSSIVESVRQASPNGGFVREESGRWYEVGDHIAREKVGQCLRDSLHTKYKSSTKAKKRRRKQRERKMVDELDRFVESNHVAASTMEQISKRAKGGVSADERTMEQFFNQANEELLQRIKRSEVSSHHHHHHHRQTTEPHSEYSYRPEEHTVNYYDPIRLEDAVGADIPSLDSSSLQHIFGDVRRNSLPASSSVPPPSDYSVGYPHINPYWSKPDEEDDDCKPKAHERM